VFDKLSGEHVRQFSSVCSHVVLRAWRPGCTGECSVHR